MKRRAASVHEEQSEPKQTAVSNCDRGTGWRGWLHRIFVQPFVSSVHPPWFDARGVAVGLAISLGCPVGLQMVMLGLMRVLLRFNLIIAFAVSWVMNPFTFVPIYYGYYRLGSALLGKPATVTSEAFHALMAPMLGNAPFWETFRSFLALGQDFALRWSVGAAVVTPITACIGYILAYYVQRTRYIRKARKLEVSYADVVRRLERRSGR